MTNKIKDLRTEIDLADAEIVKALIDRLKAVEAVAAFKRSQGHSVLDAKRRDERADHLTKMAHDLGLLDARSKAFVARIVSSIHDSSVSYMEGSSTTIETSTIPIEGIEAPFYIAGPCAIESKAQIFDCVSKLSNLGVKLVRGGAYKPRTSPRSFQGMGFAGLELLRRASDEFGVLCVSEALDSESLAAASDLADVIQIGARNMDNFSLLRRVGKTAKPVLLKRGYSAKISELMAAVEYVKDGGSEKIVVCERGIRTFETETRNTLDVSAIPIVHKKANLPVVVDVSHAAGRRDILENLAAASFAAGAEGVMIEVHPDPDTARSDPDQQITPDQFFRLMCHVKRRTNLAP
jgi:3-deoxy-7-phosphoheptulonate synthase/chorismate mutase